MQYNQYEKQVKYFKKMIDEKKLHFFQLLHLDSSFLQF